MPEVFHVSRLILPYILPNPVLAGRTPTLLQVRLVLWTTNIFRTALSDANWWCLFATEF